MASSRFLIATSCCCSAEGIVGSCAGVTLLVCLAFCDWKSGGGSCDDNDDDDDDDDEDDEDDDEDDDDDDDSVSSSFFLISTVRTPASLPLSG